MAESETPHDAAYSDEEFGSDHEEYEGGYEEFADEDEVAVTTTTDAVHEESPIEEDKYDEEEDAEQYEGEFDKDESTTRGKLPVLVAEGHVDIFDVEGPAEANAILDQGQSDASGDSEVEYSNDMENDAPVALPNAVGLPSDVSDESVTKRRASVPVSVLTSLSDDSSPKARCVRTGSMPMILPDRPIDKWMDMVPQQLSPDRTDRSMRPSALPVLDEVPAPDLVDDEVDSDTTDASSNSNSVPSFTNSRIRAQSYQDLHCEKTAVPIRRATSLLYMSSLPSVVEDYTVGDPIKAGRIHDGEDSYSIEDDEDQYDNDSQASFHSKNEDDATQPANAERLTSEPSSISDTSTPTDENTPIAHHTSSKMEASITGDLDSNAPTASIPTSVAAPHEQNLQNESAASQSQQNNDEDDDYTDELENEFPSETSTPHAEGENTPHKSTDETNDFDVDAFIDDGRRETETLLLEARTLLQQQHQHECEPTTKQTIPPDMSTPMRNNAEGAEQIIGNSEKSDDVVEEKFSTLYDNDEKFGDVDGNNPNEEASDQDALGDHDAIGQYKFDTDNYEEHETEVHENQNAPTQPVDQDKTADPDLTPNATVVDRVQSPNETICTSDSAVETENEVLPSETPISDAMVFEAVETQAITVQSTQVEASPSIQLSSSTLGEKRTTATTKDSPTSPRSDKTNVVSQPARPKQALKIQDTSSKQAAPPVKPSHPPGNRPTPAPPTLSPNSQSTITPRSFRSKLRPVGSECKTSNPNPVCNTSEATGSSSQEATAGRSPKRSHESPSKGISAPRSPSKTYSGAYQYLPIEYPPQPRKEPVPRQKASSKPSTAGEAKRRVLQPVRTPANLRFDLPRMDKKKRDWLFVNMFRHGDDLSKYEAFVPPTLLAKPPATKETKKRSLSARQIYGNPHTSRFVSAGRKLVPQPNPLMQDREQKWVATTPHDSKLPQYDSILDKYCTAVTSPFVQRQIYLTRHRDLSPQLAFVLEKRMEKHCRKGFHDSFGSVSSSYKTEIVPTSPDHGSRPRQTPPQTKSTRQQSLYQRKDNC